MAKISDKKRKKIIADYVECGNYRAVARMNGISAPTVKKYVQSDSKALQKFTQKKEENTTDILNYMDENAADIKRLLGKFLKGMEYKIDNLDMFTSLRDIATAFGVIFDKGVKSEEIRFAQKSQVSADLDNWFDTVLDGEEADDG